MRNILIAACLFFASCHAGPATRAVGVGAAAIVGVYDQLLASGEITEVQHLQVVQGVEALQKTAETAKALAENKATPEDVAKTAGGLTLTGLAVLNAMRNRSRRRELKVAKAA